MKIYRTQSNKYGWRTKFVYRQDMDISITHEHNHKGYWKESKMYGHSTHVDVENVPELIKFLKSVGRGEDDNP